MNTAEFTTPEVNLWVAVRRHWIVAALTTATIFGGMAFITLRERGIYRSESLIVIGNQVAVPIVKEDAQAEAVAENLPTEIEILQSPSLLNRAIAKLPPTYRNIPVWELQQQLSLTQPKDTNVLSIAYEDTDAVRAKTILDAVIAAYITYSEESRRSPVTNAIKFIDQRLPPLKASVEQSSSALTAFRTRNNLDNPENAVSLAYTAKEQLQQSIDVAEIERNQLKETDLALRVQMGRLGQNPDTSLAEAVLSQDKTYQFLLQQLTTLEVQYKLDQTRYTLDNPALQELRERRDELKKLLDTVSQSSLKQRHNSSTQNVDLGAIQQELASRLLQTQIGLLVSEKKLYDLRQQLATANLKLTGLLKLQQQYKELARQYELNTQTLDNLLEKLQELRIQEAQDTFIWKVIEPPNLPTIPLARNRVRGLVLGLMTGALAGIGVAFLLEKTDTRLRELKEVKKLTNLPVLGVIPQAETATAVGLQGSDTFTEAIRSLALTLSFQNTQLTGKVIAITSAIASEGKTTIAYNLALALAELDKRVLIVDANLSHPSLHEVFKLTNAQGLTTAIASDRPWQDLIQSPHGQTRAISPENQGVLVETGADKLTNGRDSGSVFARVSTAALLVAQEPTAAGPIERFPEVSIFPDILTTGPIAGGSFPWLVSLKLQQLLEQWRKVYDYILIDTSDLTGSADVQSVTSRVDEVILVVSLMRVEKTQVVEGLDLLERNLSKIAGVVVNTMGQGRGKGEVYMPFS